jgi:GNAT superfamily N-acetyltransferase
MLPRAHQPRINPAGGTRYAAVRRGQHIGAALMRFGHDARAPRPAAPIGFAMDLRNARPEDLATLDAIAFAAKAHWGYGPQQLEAWRADLRLDPGALDVRPVFVAKEAGRPIGFVQVATDCQPWALWALWVRPECMGRGVGRALLTRACDFALAGGQHRIDIDADPNAEPFYLACGVRRIASWPRRFPGSPIG